MSMLFFLSSLNNKRNFYFLILFILFTPSSQAQLPVGYSNDLVQSGYNTIMGTVFNNDGTKMFVWEKAGKVYVSNWNGTSYIKQNTPVLDISEEVGNWRDFGFSSFCLDPDYDTNGLVYMFYMVDRHHLMNFGTAQYNPNTNEYFDATISRVTRYQIDLSSNPLITDYNTRAVLLGESVSTGIPLLHESHAGGTLLFGTDGSLIVSTGDNASYQTVDTGSVNHTYYQQAITDGILRTEENVGAFRSQMITSLCGKVLRLDPVTGDGLPSNPHYEVANPRSPKSRMWAMGLRNPFRMSIEPDSGSTNPNDGNPGILHVADVGWGTWEDLHIFDKAGLNGGWPLYEGLTQHNGYYNSGTTNPDEGNVLFKDNCPQPTSFVDDPDPTQRRYVHDRPEVAWKHGSTNDARVPWFTDSNPIDIKIGVAGSPTTGIMFTGNTATGGVFIVGDKLGSSMTGKYFFTDYAKNWINVATLTDGTLNWISDVAQLAPIGFGSGIVHITQNPLDGFVYYVNIFNGNLNRISFVGPTWINEPNDMIVECDGTLDPNGAFATWLSSFTGTVTCGSPTITNNSSGLSDLCGATGSETVTFTLSDECGNVIKKDATFTIEDNTNPTFNETLPDDVTVECDNIPVAETLTASDSCGNANVVFGETPVNGSCANEETITRTWTATDDCGNETIHTQTITVQDNTNPTFNETLPADATVECDTIPAAETLTASDSCGNANVVFGETPVNGSCANEETITRTWTATDDCGNETIHIQTIIVEDNTDPTWINEPTNMTVECSANPNDGFIVWLNSFSGTDNCGTASVSNNNSVTIDCGESVTVTFTLTDECGNFIEIDATYNVDETLGIPNSSETKIIIYPNPTRNNIFIKGIKSNTALEIYTISGQLILNKKIDDNEEINLNLPSGFYLIKIRSKDRVATKKFIIKN